MIRFGTTGIRGIVHKTLPITLAPVVGLAAAKYFSRGTIAIGHDARIHSLALYHGAISGALSGGSDVIALDYAPTPTVQYFVKAEKLSGGLVITASHNPPEYNGFKFVERDGRDLSKASEKYIEDIINDILSNGYVSHRADFGELYESDEALMIHIKGIIEDLEDVVES
jgi:phosphomannomutase